jgi:hypothetical protein
MKHGVGQFVVRSYENDIEIDRCGPFTLYIIAERYAKDQSMMLGTSVTVNVTEVSSSKRESSYPDGKILCKYRRGRKLTIQTS